MRGDLLLAFGLLGMIAVSSGDLLEVAVIPEACDEGQAVRCLTCYNVGSIDECLAAANYIQCHQEDPMCQVTVHSNDNGDVNQFSSQCMQREACDNHIEDIANICTKLLNNSICAECITAPEILQCSEIPEACDEGQAVQCLTCHNVGSIDECLAGQNYVQCHQEYPMCQVTVHSNDNGDVYQFSSQCMQKEACNNHIEDIANICTKLMNNSICRECTTAPDILQCSEIAEACVEGQGVQCLTCYNVGSIDECLAGQNYVQCHQQDSMCQVTVHSNDNGDVYQFSSQCMQRQACKNHIEDIANICTKLLHNSICRECTTAPEILQCYDPCDGVVCQNGGTCVDGVCQCPPGGTGTNCETMIPGVCVCRLLGDPAIQKFANKGPFNRLEANAIVVLVDSDVENCAFRVESLVQKKGNTDLPQWLTVAMEGIHVNFTNSHQIRINGGDLQDITSAVNLSDDMTLYKSNEFIILENIACEIRIGYDPDGDDTQVTIVVNTDLGPHLTGECGKCFPNI